MADVNTYLDLHQRTCNYAMRPAKPPKRPETVGRVGWTPELRELRREANRCSRRKQRAYRGTPEHLAQCSNAYSRACKELGIAMLRERLKAWTELCGTLDNDMWGRPYRVVMAQLKAKMPPPSLTREMASKVIRGLFPVPREAEACANPMVGIPYPHRRLDENPEEWRVDAQELQEVVSKLDGGKPPGWDSVPPRVVKGLGNYDPQRLLAAVN